MRRCHALHVGVAVLMLLPLLGALASNAGAQMDGGQGLIDLPLKAQRSSLAWVDTEVREILLAEGLLLLLVVLELGVACAVAAAFDAWRERRAEEAARLRGLLANALQHDRLLKDLAVTPVVHLPLWGRSGATVELRGQVPTHGLRYAVLQAATLEASKNMAACTIDDRLVIASSPEALAA